MESTGSVSCWIVELKKGDEQAAQRLWERYYARLLGLASKMMGDSPRRMADEHDIVQNAYNSFCVRARKGLFPNLRDRDELWSLLVVITARKVANQRDYQMRAKRGGSVRGDSVFAQEGGKNADFSEVIGREPTPEFAAQISEELERLLTALEDVTQRDIAVWKLEGWTNKEIAGKLECSLSAVERKLRLIRRRLTELDDSPHNDEDQASEENS